MQRVQDTPLGCLLSAVQLFSNLQLKSTFFTKINLARFGVGDTRERKGN